MAMLGIHIYNTAIEKSGFLGSDWVYKILFWLYKIVQKKVQNTVKVWYYFSKVAVLVIGPVPFGRKRVLISSQLKKTA
jgi:hypothetical protein